MGAFGTIPPEPAACADPAGLCPAFRAKLDGVLARLTTGGWQPVLRETTRSDEREAWLYGFGREYDDGRGIVTYSPDGTRTWHRTQYALASDVGDGRWDDGEEPEAFYAALYAAVVAEAGLTSGQDWHHTGQRQPDDVRYDGPHVQWRAPGMNLSPGQREIDLLAAGGRAAVWAAVGAN